MATATSASRHHSHTSHDTAAMDIRQIPYVRPNHGLRTHVVRPLCRLRRASLLRRATVRREPRTAGYSEIRYRWRRLLHSRSIPVRRHDFTLWHPTAAITRALRRLRMRQIPPRARIRHMGTCVHHHHDSRPNNLPPHHKFMR